MQACRTLGTSSVVALALALVALAPACGTSTPSGSTSDGGGSGSSSGSGGSSGSSSGGGSGSSSGSSSGGGSGGGSSGDDGGGNGSNSDGGACTGGGTPGGGGPTGGPADLFPCDSPWYQDVTNAPLASDSSSIIGGLTWGHGGQMQIDFSIVFQHATASSPRVAFTLSDTGDSDTSPVPVPVGGTLEGETGYTCTGGGDCHLLVVDDAAQKLFELWSVQSVTGTTGNAAQETVWDLTKHYPPAGRGPGCSSADAAGLAITPGLIGVRETKAGVIKHALRFILPNDQIRGGAAWVAPGSHGTSSTTSTTGPAYGMHLRLHAGFDASKISSPGGKAVVQALKTYGMFLADGGNDIFTAESDSLESKADPTMTWGTTLGSNDLAAILPSDFDVLEYATPMGSGDDCKPNSFF